MTMVAIGFTFTTLLATLTHDNKNDFRKWNAWFSSVGIEKVESSIQILTTEKSVAGRGVFAKESFDVGETIVKIPPESIFTTKTAKQEFPQIAKQLGRYRRQERGIFGIKSVFKYLTRKKRKGETTRNYSWPAELTAYAIQALEEDHPWATWISDWQRDDPVSSMFERCVSSSDIQKISETANELHQMNPALSKEKLETELHTKLVQFEEHKRIYNLGNDAMIAKIYSTLCSRVMYLGRGMPGVIPMFDMINHSMEPNVGLSFDGSKFFLYALHDIYEGEELLVCYTNPSEQLEWDEDTAMSTLLTWGIPHLPPNNMFGQSSNSDMIQHKEISKFNMTSYTTSA